MWPSQEQEGGRPVVFRASNLAALSTSRPSRVPQRRTRLRPCGSDAHTQGMSPGLVFHGRASGNRMCVAGGDSMPRSGPVHRQRPSRVPRRPLVRMQLQRVECARWPLAPVDAFRRYDARALPRPADRTSPEPPRTLSADPPDPRLIPRRSSRDPATIVESSPCHRGPPVGRPVQLVVDRLPCSTDRGPPPAPVRPPFDWLVDWTTTTRPGPATDR